MTEIIFRKHNTKFEDIDVGECFIGINGAVCMRVDNGGVVGYNAVDIESGRMSRYPLGYSVIPVKVKIIVEELL